MCTIRQACRSREQTSRFIQVLNTFKKKYGIIVSKILLALSNTIFMITILFIIINIKILNNIGPGLRMNDVTNVVQLELILT